MRIVFMGTPEYGVPSLKAILSAGHEVIGVFTQPDKPKGRGNKVEFSPVKQCAVEHGIPVFQPKRIRVDGVEDLRALAPDLCVTAAFGQILSEEVLGIPRFGTVNVHASLLPKYRGSSPINWCIMQGEKVTGVTTMMTDKGIDTGDILMSRAVDILPEETAGELTVRMADVGAELLAETLAKLEKGTCPRVPQDHTQMSYFPMLKKELGALNWQKSAEALANCVRGLSPWPGAYFTLQGEIIKVWSVAAVAGDADKTPGTVLCAGPKEGFVVQCAEGTLCIKEIQAPGGKRMDARDYLRGHPLTTKELESAGNING